VAKTAKPPALKTDGFAFLPTNADFRDGIVGAVEPAMGGRYLPTLRPPCVVRKGRRLPSDRKSIGSAQSASSGFFAAAEPTGDQLAYGCGTVPSVSVPELGLPAGSTVLILSH
jgi:hypothetical protein